jgi:hypothetical protein
MWWKGGKISCQLVENCFLRKKLFARFYLANNPLHELISKIPKYFIRCDDELC